MKEPSKAAVIYARYSSERQNEQSIEGQLTVIKAFAERENYSIVETYIDRALSGRSDDRPSFQKMIDDSKKGQFQYVIVYKLDRFSRDRYDSAIYKRKLKLNGVRVVSATERIDDSPEGVIFESILEGYAEYYSAELAQKVRRGNQESRKKGLYTGGIVPYGFRVKNKRYYVDEKEAEIVKEIYKKSIAGKTLKQIAKSLNARGIPYKNGVEWDINSLSRTIRNKKYIGIVTANGEEFDNICPPIISKRIFDKAQKLSQKRRHSNHAETTQDYFLSKISCCAKCGSSVIGKSGNSQKGHGTYYYYECSRRVTEKNCELPVFSKKFLENHVYDAVVEDLLNQNIEELINDICNYYSNEKQSDKELYALKTRLNKVEIEIRNSIHAIQKGLFSKSIKESVEKSEKEKEILESQIKDFKTKSTNSLERDLVKEFLMSSRNADAIPLEVKKEIVYTLAEDVCVDSDNIKITVYSPYDEAKNKDSFKTISRSIDIKTMKPTRIKIAK